MFSLPFGLWLGDYDLPLRVAFVVWGECFVFGGKLAGLRQLIPAFTIGALAAGIVQSFAMALADPFGTAELVTAGDLAVAMAYSAGFGIAVHIMRFVRVLRDGTPACFQGDRHHPRLHLHRAGAGYVGPRTTPTPFSAAP